MDGHGLTNEEILTKSLEKAIKLIQELELKLTTAEESIKSLNDRVSTVENSTGDLQRAHNEHQFNTSGPSAIYEYMMEEKDKPAFDIPLTPREIQKMLEARRQRDPRFSK